MASIELLKRGRGVFIRLYRPTEEYLENPFSTPTGAYIPSSSAVFSLAKLELCSLDGVWTGHAWLFPEEIRLVAAIALSVPEACGMLPFLPHSEGHVLDVDFGTDLSSSDVIEHATRHAADLAAAIYGTEVQYVLRSAHHSGDAFQRELYDSIDVGNPVLIRSLYALLKSQDLARVQHGSYMEEAIMNVQIAREGAIDLVREVLAKGGAARTSERDVFDYLRQNFAHGDALAEYLDDQRQRWVKTKHPRSALGVFWAPPIEADDFFETYEALVSIFRHILVGEVGRSSACFDPQ